MFDTTQEDMQAPPVLVAPRADALLLRWLRPEHVVNRLVSREFAPFFGNALLWSQIALHVGGKQAVMLGAANIASVSAVNLTLVATRGVIRRRRGASDEVWHQTRRRAWTIEAGSAIACVVAVTAASLAYWAMGRGPFAMLLLIQALGVPARFNGPLRERTRFAYLYRFVRAWSGVMFVGAVLAFGGSLIAAAAAVALREWLALAIMALLPAQDSPPTTIDFQSPELAEFAAATAVFSAQRVVYRIGKSLLGLVFGPAGNALARTGRGFRLQQRFNTGGLRVSRMIDALALFGTAAAFAIPAEVRGPGAILIGTTLLRIGFSALSAAFWTRLSRGLNPSTDDDEDDDD